MSRKPFNEDKTSREDAENASTQLDTSPANTLPVLPALKSNPSQIKPDTSEWRPLSMLKWGLSNSTRIIGWNDDDFRGLLEEHRRRRIEDPSIPNVEKTGFGLMGILASTIKEALYKGTNFDDLKSDLKKLEKVDEVDSSNSASSIDIIGTNINVREMKVYKNLLSAVKYQRDAYIMGTEHAEQRKVDREIEVELVRERDVTNQFDPYIADDENNSLRDGRNERLKLSRKTPYQDYLNKHPNVNVSSLGVSQLNELFTWFIPSTTMHEALLPTVLWTIVPPSPTFPEGGPLRGRINRSICDLIPLSQSLLDQSMKQSLLWFLKDDAWRESVKGSSRNYLSAAEGNQTGNPVGQQSNVVTTKTLRLYK